MEIYEYDDLTKGSKKFWRLCRPVGAKENGKNLGAKSFACCEYQMRNLSILGEWPTEKEGRKQSDPSILILFSGSGSS